MSKRQIHSLISIISVFVIWEIIALFVSNRAVFPHISDVFVSTMSLLKDPYFYRSFFVTSLTGLSAFLLSFLIAFGALYMLYIFPVLKTYVQTLAGVVKSLPVASVTILFLIWIKTSSLPFYVAFIMSVPIVLETVCLAEPSFYNQNVESAIVLGVGKTRIFFDICLFNIRTLLLSALRSALPVAFKSAIAAEVIALVRNSLGNIMYESKIFFETDRLIAVTLIVVIAVKIYETILAAILKKLCYIKKNER